MGPFWNSAPATGTDRRRARGRSAGFAAVELIDAGPFADLQPAAMRRLFTSLGAEPAVVQRNCPPADVLQGLGQLGIWYRLEA